jgi:hypothetical protein
VILFGLRRRQGLFQCIPRRVLPPLLSYIEPVAQELGELRAKIAVVGVLGNHDWWEDAPLMRREFHKAGILLLDNDRRVLTPGRALATREKEGLALCGVGDLWEDRIDYARALDGLAPGMPRLLLSHNPDVAEERAFIQGDWRVDLMLSGHTHGGQVVLPGLGAPVTSSRYGDKYAQGLVGRARMPGVCQPRHRRVGVSAALSGAAGDSAAGVATGLAAGCRTGNEIRPKPIAGRFQASTQHVFPKYLAARGGGGARWTWRPERQIRLRMWVCDDLGK